MSLVQHLQCFWAVTVTSLYRIDAFGGQNRLPVAEKVAMRGESSVAVGACLGNDYPRLSIGRQLIWFIPEGGGMTSLQFDVGLVNTRYWGPHTSEVVALFLEEGSARECFQTGDCYPADSRWHKQTKEVLEAICSDHTTLSVCHAREMSLL